MSDNIVGINTNKVATIAAEIKDVLVKLGNVQDVAPVYLHTLHQAIEMLESTSSLPLQSSYGIHHIDADNFKDAKLKFVLATYPSYKRYTDGKISLTEAHACIEMLGTLFAQEAIKRLKDDGEDSPVSIKVPDLSEPATEEDLIQMHQESLEQTLDLGVTGYLSHTLGRAVRIMAERGVPTDFENYDSEHIYAVDIDDLELKLALVVARYFKEVRMNRGLKPEYALVFWRPLLNALIAKEEAGALEESDFPLTIKA